jgi:alpha-D-ribose 1-methylphosphonate 5-triphosphate synthase subunit PhnG
MMQASDSPSREPLARKTMMGLLARASRAELVEALARLEPLPACEDVRPPEIGLVMLRGRMAGTGAPFNLGEATVTRAAVRLASGELGFSYVLGRDRERARLAAFVDALWAMPAWRERLDREIMDPLAARLAERDRMAADETAATRVDFFTLVRGEDPVR